MTRRLWVALLTIQFVFLLLPAVPTAQAAECVTPTQSSLTDGGLTYIMQTFTSVSANCTWDTPLSVSSIQLLIVGGGGGAGFGSCGGGGGAGRVIVSSSSLNVTGGTSLTLKIGSGGTGGFINSGDWRAGLKGDLSSVTIAGTTYQASGGGGGGGNSASVGLAGGSGGGGTACGTVGSGGSADTSLIAAFTTYATSGASGNSSGGGGGGAGAAATNSKGGDGVTVWGVTLAGGGGGWAGGGGGLGGGGSASSASNTKENSGNAGAAGTGSGGGGGNDGGSGRIAVRYLADTTAPTITGPASVTGANSSISIPENSTAVHTFTANESVTWSKSGTDGSFFAINSSSGVLTISARDFESPADNGSNNAYIVTITATDGASNATSQTLTVTITNINEAPTISIASSAATHSVTQAENSTTAITYVATDPDAGSSLTFSISGTDAADFTINSSTGVLEFATAPDFEAPVDSNTNNTYIVIITVSDGALSDTQELTVSITNANESANIGAPSVAGAIHKGTSTTVTVTTGVAGKVRFFVSGKRISTCLAITTTGSYPTYSATCLWKPPVRGRQNLTARITPTDASFSATTSENTSVWVNKRTNSR